MGNILCPDTATKELDDEESLDRQCIIDEYESELDSICCRHPLSPQSIATYITEEFLVIIYKRRAYDCTSWLPIHPGGHFVLLRHAGRDVSVQFDKLHSRRAKALLRDLLIGNVFYGRAGRPELPPLLTPRGRETTNHTMRIVRVIPVAHDVVRIILAYPERLRAELGAHMAVHYRGTSRMYNPCFIEETNFSLIVKKYSDGLISSYVHSLRPGDAIELHGPFPPKFCVVGRRYRTMVLIGQGTGTVPLFAIAKSIIAEVIFFVACFRHISDVFLASEMADLPENVRMIYFISKGTPSDAEKVPGVLMTRRLDERGLQCLNMGSIDCAIVCGSEDFFCKTKKYLLKAADVSPDDIHEM